MISAGTRNSQYLIQTVSTFLKLIFYQGPRNRIYLGEARNFFIQSQNFLLQYSWVVHILEGEFLSKSSLLENFKFFWMLGFIVIRRSCIIRPLLSTICFRGSSFFPGCPLSKIQNIRDWFKCSGIQLKTWFHNYHQYLANYSQGPQNEIFLGVVKQEFFPFIFTKLLNNSF